MFDRRLAHAFVSCWRETAAVDPGAAIRLATALERHGLPAPTNVDGLLTKGWRSRSSRLPRGATQIIAFAHLTQWQC
jgi:hypothetical protein